MSLPAPSESEESCEMPLKPAFCTAPSAARLRSPCPLEPQELGAASGESEWLLQDSTAMGPEEGSVPRRGSWSTRTHLNSSKWLSFPLPRRTSKHLARLPEPRAGGGGVAEEEYLVWRPAAAWKVQSSGCHCHHHPDRLLEPQPALKARSSAAPHPRLSPGSQGRPAAATG